MLNSQEKRRALSLYRMDNDPGDLWGSAMMHLGGIADALYCFTDEINGEWGYVPSPYVRAEDVADEWPASEYVQDLEDSTYSVDELVYAGGVLSRYANLLDKRGLSY